MENFPLIFEISRDGVRGYEFPEDDILNSENIKDKSSYDIDEAIKNNKIDKRYIREKKAFLPQVAEVDLVRHFVNLSRRNFGVDVGFYPLGSCTMKYNPKINEDVSSFEGFKSIHPLVGNFRGEEEDYKNCQGILELQYKLLELLCKITGMKWGTLAPFAGAHGEYVGMKLFKAYFDEKEKEGLNGAKRKKILIPDSAHGTNPASAHIAGFEVIEIKSGPDGLVDVEEIKKYINDELAGIMLTNPNTLGLFEERIVEIAELVHKAGGLLYYDGANFNAIMGRVKPGAMGFDCVHLNLHKTFSTPHGGGGPGSGPILVNDRLLPYLPIPDIKAIKIDEKGKDGNKYFYKLDYSNEKSIGKVSGFYGNIAVLVKAFTYILINGDEGLKSVSEKAVINANYLKEKLKRYYFLPYDRICKHEFVLSGKKIKEEKGVSTLDIAKRLLDYGIHPPTIYFPLIVPEALMIEPTETESKETLDNFIDVMIKIYEEIEKDPEILHNAPINTPVRRLDEIKAAKDMKLKA
ncbi:MAG: aminomethyl-transferring glycine dehydrogenase subunit GcvPB [Spirochaetes bacterium]|nr:aminomethyl-transferring glycine dehydrogenase subunit GcvPB [Spirochaetota bacterium]